MVFTVGQRRPRGSSTKLLFLFPAAVLAALAIAALLPRHHHQLESASAKAALDSSPPPGDSRGRGADEDDHGRVRGDGLMPTLDWTGKQAVVATVGPVAGGGDEEEPAAAETTVGPAAGTGDEMEPEAAEGEVDEEEAPAAEGTPVVPPPAKGPMHLLGKMPDNHRPFVSKFIGGAAKSDLAYLDEKNPGAKLQRFAKRYGPHPNQVLNFWEAKPSSMRVHGKRVSKGQAGPRPLVIHLHGGGWMMGDYREDIPRSLLSYGVSYASVEYRRTCGKTQRPHHSVPFRESRALNEHAPLQTLESPAATGRGTLERTA